MMITHPLVPKVFQSDLQLGLTSIYSHLLPHVSVGCYFELSQERLFHPETVLPNENVLT